VDGPVSGSSHRNVNPESLAPPTGYAHATVAAPGRVVYLGGQTGHRADGSIDDGLVEQFDRAAWNVAEALRAAGGAPEHLVRVIIYVTDLEAYRRSLGPIGEAYRHHLGRHYPAMALLGVAELFDPAAKVELVGTAVIPDGG
jgi:enamine deaminase RidA (YjgF/YER057c/UK114 family)